jgi:hypothetical protein
MLRSWWAFCLAVMALSAFASWSGPAQASQTRPGTLIGFVHWTGTVDGTVPPPTPDGVSGEINVSQDGRHVATTWSLNGKFEFTLAPGSYTVDLAGTFGSTSTGGNKPPCRASGRVVVRSGKFTQETLHCSTLRTASKSSPIEGLPVPVQAMVTSASSSTSSYTSSATYVLPVGVSLASVDTWYQEQLPAGKGWRNWTPHPPPGTDTWSVNAPVPAFVRTWHRTTTQLTIGVGWTNFSQDQVQILISDFRYWSFVPST